MYVRTYVHAQITHIKCCTFVIQSENSNVSIYTEFLKLLNLPGFCLPTSQPAVRPTSTKCTAPEIPHNKGDRCRFMKLLFRLRFVHCAIVIPFILHYPSLFFYIPLHKVRNLRKKVSISCFDFCLLRHTRRLAYVI